MVIDFLAESKALQSELVQWRRDIHAHPELGFTERRTANLVAQELSNLGMTVTTGVAQTGVVGLLIGKKPGPKVMLRVDMDALPIQEQNNTSYISTVPGVMHACGHDGHVAIGLAVAKMLSQYRELLCGSVMFVFQPAEEGLGGAKLMIEEGVLQDHTPDVVLGLHLINDFPVGELVVHDGALATSHDKLHCTIRGKGGHGAIPNLARDPLVAAAQVITALQTIVSRNLSPLDTGVVTIATMQAEGAFNIIPESVKMTGTIRTFHPEVQELIHKRVHEIIEGIANAMGCETEIAIEPINPAIINDPEVTAIVYEAAKEIVGIDHINTTYRASGSDDVAFFLEKIPGCHIFIGSANSEKGFTSSVHHPLFDFDETALVVGSATIATAIKRYLIKD